MDVNLARPERAFVALVLVLLLSAAWTWANRVTEVNAADADRIAAPHANFAAPPFVLADVAGPTVDLDALQGAVFL